MPRVVPSVISVRLMAPMPMIGRHYERPIDRDIAKGFNCQGFECHPIPGIMNVRLT